ncbi:hypothetical protein AB0K51_12340 [Kitasatospora sp. NPDC049285]|uniref:hypothetical protein n=1 Tax=Kitasatospora sp. NPDC049285 TaxID=3157096 RepID=UPI0034156814
MAEQAGRFRAPSSFDVRAALDTLREDWGGTVARFDATRARVAEQYETRIGPLGSVQDVMEARIMHLEGELDILLRAVGVDREELPASLAWLRSRPKEES